MTSQVMTHQFLTAPSAEAQFLEELKQGDENAWSQLVTGEYGTRLHAYLRHQLPTAEDAEDLFNDVWLAVVRGIQKFDSNYPLIHWIFVIAHYKVAEYYQSLYATLSHFGIQRGESAYSLEWQAQFDMLPLQARQAVVFRYHLGLTIKEIAQRLGQSYEATEQLLQQARTELANAPQAYWAVRQQPVTDASLSVLHQVQVQWQKCIVLGMDAEAAIFAEHTKLLEQMLEMPPMLPAYAQESVPPLTWRVLETQREKLLEKS